MIKHHLMTERSLFLSLEGLGMPAQIQFMTNPLHFISYCHTALGQGTARVAFSAQADFPG